MSGSVFRTVAEPSSDGEGQSAANNSQAKETSNTQQNSVEVPYLDYENTNHIPYSVKYFELGNLWDDSEGGFVDEIETIEDYMKSLIKDEKLDNKTGSVKAKLKEIEKMANISKTERQTSRIKKIASFTKFLSETHNL